MEAGMLEKCIRCSWNCWPSKLLEFEGMLCCVPYERRGHHVLGVSFDTESEAL